LLSLLVAAMAAQDRSALHQIIGIAPATKKKPTESHLKCE
jgi:hypothetical protein